MAVLARVEHIAKELKEALAGTAILEPNGLVSYEDVEKIRKAVLALTPLGGTASPEVWAKYPQSTRQYMRDQAARYGYPDSDVYIYPTWDELSRAENPEAYMPLGEHPTGDRLEEVRQSIKQARLADEVKEDTEPGKPKVEVQVPQEINFYRRLGTHVLLAPVFIEELVSPINRIIAQANESGETLPEGAFGYLRKEDGTYRILDVNRMKVRMLLHDIGRWATHHQYLHESMPDLIAHYLGIKPPLIQYEFDHEFRYHSEGEGSDSLVDPQNIPIEESMFHFIDFIAKRKEENDTESTEIRNLDQLVEHALSRAAGYNGALAEYLREVDSSTPVINKVMGALHILEKSPDPHQAQFYRREIMFLEKALEFFGAGGRDGILAKAGISLDDVIDRCQKRFEALLDSFGLYAYYGESEREERSKQREEVQKSSVTAEIHRALNGSSSN